MSTGSDRYGRIFLLSHMRAFTSLAGHILGSHPQINGYYEMHISYADAAALDKQLEVYQQGDALKPNSRYVFDKLLHNDYELVPAQLGVADIKILISLLEPEQTIKSIVDLFSNKPTRELYASPDEAAKYYSQRLQALTEFCSSVRQPYYYYDAEMFQAAPKTLLPKLTAWLELESPLTEEYQIFSHTGKTGKGDSSKFIHSGKIDRTPIDYSHVTLPAEVLNAAQGVYAACRQEIMAKAVDVVTI